MTEINFDVLTPEKWRARPGAFSPRSAFPAPQSALQAQQQGHINNYNHMTSVYAVGEGASGPPPYREPA